MEEVDCDLLLRLLHLASRSIIDDVMFAFSCGTGVGEGAATLRARLMTFSADANREGNGGSSVNDRVFGIVFVTLSLGLILVPFWWISFRIWGGNESVINRITRLGKGLHLPDWISSSLHRIYVPLAAGSFVGFIPLLTMLLLVLSGITPVEKIEAFNAWFVIYWPIVVGLSFPLAISVLFYGKPRWLVPKFDRGNPSVLDTLKSKRRR